MAALNEFVEIKPYTITELANIYGVKSRTMRNWITPHNDSIGLKIGRLFTTLQVKIIFEKLGMPGKMED